MTVKVILYSAVWCPHCIAFLPMWEKVTEYLNKMGIENIRYEDPKDAEIMAKDKYKYGWSGVPTLMVIVNDVPYIYEGDRSNLQAIINFINTTISKTEKELDKSHKNSEIKRCSLMSVKNPVAIQQGGCGDNKTCSRSGQHSAKYYYKKYRKYKKKYQKLQKS